MWVVCRVSTAADATKSPPGNRAHLTRAMVLVAELGKPVDLHRCDGRAAVRRRNGQRVEEVGESERRSVIDRIEVAPVGNITSPETAPTSNWFEP